MRFLRKSQAWQLLVIIFCLVLAACRQGTAVNEAPNPSLSHKSGGTSVTAPADNVRLMKPGASVSKAQSYSALMLTLSAKDQTRVRDWYKRSGAPAMDAATANQIAWMQARGYPMPQDIARATLMTDTALKAAASTDDITAKILYTSRLLDEFEALIVTGISHNDDRRLHLVIEIQQAMLRALASGSPYAGYLYAMKARLMYPDNIESTSAAQLAGWVWASKFGDTRAIYLMKKPTVQAVDASTAASEMSVMLVMALNTNPEVFSTPVVFIPQR